MKAVILAAGRGTRMRGLCDNVPKPMLPLANMPVLEYILLSLGEAGVSETCVIVGHQADEIRRGLPRRAPAGMALAFVDQANPNGTGSAALLGKAFVGNDPFLLLFADIVVPRGAYAGMRRDFDRGGRDAMLSIRVVPDPCFGAAVYVEKGLVKRIVEKPPRGTSTTSYDNAGHFIMPPRVFDYLERLKPSPRGEYELTDAIAAMIADGLRFGAHEIGGFWYNLTDPETLLRANADIIEEVESTFLMSGASEVRPPVAISGHARCDAARLGPNVSIADKCDVSSGAILEQAILMAGAKVGPNARVSHAILAPRAVVPAGATVAGTAEQVAIVRGEVGSKQ